MYIEQKKIKFWTFYAKLTTIRNITNEIILYKIWTKIHKKYEMHIINAFL